MDVLGVVGRRFCNGRARDASWGICDVAGVVWDSVDIAVVAWTSWGRLGGVGVVLSSGDEGEVLQGVGIVVSMIFGRF